MDGNTIRLRASCNACNESKVRCSQHKPTCARCERNGNECIYGLSRRTHKDAPPISMSSSRRTQRSSRSSSNEDSNSSSNWRRSPFTRSGTTTPPQSRASSDQSTGTNDSAFFDDYMSPAGSHFLIPSQQNDEAAATPPFHMYTPTADSIRGAGQLLDFNSLVTDGSCPILDPLNAAATQFPTPFPTPGAEYANPWVLGSLFGTGSNGDGNADMAAFWARQMATAGPTPEPPSPFLGECTCHAGITELLASMRRGGDNRRLSLDAQLAKLKRCIMSSEMSLGCVHSRKDAEPIHIMAVATLIGYVIDEFKTLASEPPLSRSSSASDMAALGNTERGPKSVSIMATNISMGDLHEPRLSWGVLELEDEDEMDLRQRLCLLSFRKLERLLSQLTLYLRSLHDAQAGLPDLSRHMAFVMACDYTRLWLEKKAEDVKRLFSVSVGDEMMVDPVLA